MNALHEQVDKALNISYSRQQSKERQTNKAYES